MLSFISQAECFSTELPSTPPMQSAESAGVPAFFLRAVFTPLESFYCVVMFRNEINN